MLTSLTLKPFSYVTSLMSASDELDHVASLERAAHTALYLIHDLHTSSEQVSALTSKMGQIDASALPSLRTPLENDTERAQFVMKLAPRIRRLESDVLSCLVHRLEQILKQVQTRAQSHDGDSSSLWAGREEVRCLSSVFLLPLFLSLLPKLNADTFTLHRHQHLLFPHSRNCS